MRSWCVVGRLESAWCVRVFVPRSIWLAGCALASVWRRVFENIVFSHSERLGYRGAAAQTERMIIPRLCIFCVLFSSHLFVCIQNTEQIRTRRLNASMFEVKRHRLEAKQNNIWVNERTGCCQCKQCRHFLNAHIYVSLMCHFFFFLFWFDLL